MGAERIRGPEQYRIPMLGFQRDQGVGMTGAVEQHVGVKVFCDVVGDGLDPIR